MIGAVRVVVVLACVACAAAQANMSAGNMSMPAGNMSMPAGNMSMSGGQLALPAGNFLMRQSLPYAPSALEPAIDTLTMNLHHTIHYQAFFTNLGPIVSANPGLRALGITGMVRAVATNGSLPAASARAIRNNAGGAWNHAQYWKIMAAPGSPPTRESAITPELRDAINSSFGSVAALRANMTDAGRRVFGSGWSWLCFTGRTDQPLAVVSSPNQDNPLMGTLGGLIAQACSPIAGIDVWEHAYYKKYGPGRADYLAAWWTVVNWQQISRNLAWAKAGRFDEIGQP